MDKQTDGQGGKYTQQSKPTAERTAYSMQHGAGANAYKHFQFECLSFRSKAPACKGQMQP